jgi:hypothetical protein
MGSVGTWQLGPQAGYLVAPQFFNRHLIPFILSMQRFEDDADTDLRAVLKADEYARVRAQRTAQKRAYRQGRRPNK